MIKKPRAKEWLIDGTSIYVEEIEGYGWSGEVEVEEAELNAVLPKYFLHFDGLLRRSRKMYDYLY